MTAAGRADRSSARRETPRRERAETAAMPVSATLALAAFAALLVFAPAASNFFWAVNGLHSLPAPEMAGVLLLAAVAALPALLRLRGNALWWTLAALLALAVAFPLRERIHLLGDTQYRLRALHAVSLGMTDSIRLLANPLDLALDVWGALMVHALQIPLLFSISLLGLALGLAYLAAAWRVAGRLHAPPELRIALALAIALTGTLEGFAGYAEVSGLVAAAAMWWWAELLAPLKGRAQAGRLTLAFLVLLLGHRIAVVAIVPQLWRSLGPPAEGDQPQARRLLTGLTCGAIALAVVAVLAAGLAPQLARDVSDLVGSLFGKPLRPSDSVNGLLLVAPFALLAPFLAGGRRLKEWMRSPLFGWMAVAALPLLVALAWVFPIGETGLGAHRDWDANVLLGVTLSVGAASLLVRLPAERLRTALVLVLPLLALQTFGWLVVNADTDAATQRAVALGRDAPLLPPAQLAHVHDYFGQRAMDERDPVRAARHYEQAYQIGGNPRRLLLEAEAWMVSGDSTAAAQALSRARSRGPLNAELETSARELEQMLRQGGAPR